MSEQDPLRLSDDPTSSPLLKQALSDAKSAQPTAEALARITAKLLAAQAAGASGEGGVSNSPSAQSTPPPNASAAFWAKAPWLFLALPSLILVAVLVHQSLTQPPQAPVANRAVVPPVQAVAHNHQPQSPDRPPQLPQSQSSSHELDAGILPSNHVPSVDPRCTSSAEAQRIRSIQRHVAEQRWAEVLQATQVLCPRSPYAEERERAIILAQYRQGQIANARSGLERFARQHPGSAYLAPLMREILAPSP